MRRWFGRYILPNHSHAILVDAKALIDAGTGLNAKPDNDLLAGVQRGIGSRLAVPFYEVGVQVVSATSLSPAVSGSTGWWHGRKPIFIEPFRVSAGSIGGGPTDKSRRVI